jgi:hypothetical protein
MSPPVGDGAVRYTRYSFAPAQLFVERDRRQRPGLVTHRVELSLARSVVETVAAVRLQTEGLFCITCVGVIGHALMADSSMFDRQISARSNINRPSIRRCE